MNKNTVILLLIIINVIFRLPYTPHEVGNDSLVIHWYGQSIITEGRPSWLLHPMSFFGLYPYSYPSFVPYLLALTSVITGMSIESVIYILGLFFSILGILSIYILSKEITNSEITAVLSAFIFSLSPLFVHYTYWTISTRGLFVTLLPFVFYFFIKWFKSRKIIWSLLGFLTLLMELTIHQMYFILIPFYILSFFITIIYFQEKIHKTVARYSRPVIISVIILFFVFFTLQFTNLDFFKGNRVKYRTGFFLTAGTSQEWNSGTENKAIILANMLIDYFSSIGIAFIFFPLGLFYLTKKILNTQISFGELNIYIFLLPGGLIYTLGLYTTLIYLPIFSIISAIGIERLHQKILKSINNGFAQSIISCLLVGFLIFSVFMIHHWNSDSKRSDVETRFIDNKEYSGIRFLTSLPPGTILSKNRVRQVTALSYRPVFPFITKRYSPELLSYGIIETKDVKTELSIEIISKPDYFWELSEPLDVKGDISRLFNEEINQSEGIIDTYDLRYYISYESNFWGDIEDSKNKIYSNQLQSIYLIEHDQ